MEGTEQTQSLVVGQEKYRGRDDYLKSIMSVYTRIAMLSGGNEQKENLLWDLEYSTKILINSIISPDDRDKIRKAYEMILQIELLKRVDDPTKCKNMDDIKNSLPTKDSYTYARIDACMTIIGETRTYYDRYFGFETKMEVMRRALPTTVKMDDTAV